MINNLLFLSFIFYLFTPSSGSLATGYYNQSSNKIDVKIGVIDKVQGTCWASYENTITENGWYKYSVEGREGADPNEMGYCVGYLEGYLAQPQIYDAFNLFLDTIFGNRSNLPYPEKFTEYMKQNHDFAFSDNFKNERSYQVFLNMFSGLSDGYNFGAIEYCSKQTDHCNKTIDRYLLWSYSSNGDLIDILPMLGLMKYSDPMRARCTAFIKLLPDYSDIFMSHNTWTDYRQLHAVLKRITLPIDFFAAKTVVFSTRIGMVGSVDDFYVSDSNLMVFETSLLNNNETYLKSYVTPQRLNYWVRANAAMFAAHNGEEWVDLFIKDNSGTYNNDYYVIDINKFTPGKKPTKDLVWLIEQTPSDKIYKSDVTENLTKKGHIASFNVPVSNEIYDLMDYAKFAKLNTLYVPFFNNCRYLISERELPKVKNFDDFLHIGRYNHYITDEYSKGNPLATIAARNELNTSKENDDYFDGALDNKACRASEVFTRLDVHAVNSPTSEGGEVPIFSFNFDRLKNFPHDGLPDEWNFSYIRFGYNHEAFYNNIERCPTSPETTEEECLKIKFCGWCGETKKCLPGTLNDKQPLFGEECPNNSWRTRPKENFTWVIVGASVAGGNVLIAILVGLIIYAKKKKQDYESLLRQ